jgi:hypothetical protein
VGGGEVRPLLAVEAGEPERDEGLQHVLVERFELRRRRIGLRGADGLRGAEALVVALLPRVGFLRPLELDEERGALLRHGGVDAHLHCARLGRLRFCGVEDVVEVRHGCTVSVLHREKRRAGGTVREPPARA